ncbi:MAG TPA: hypothetical protein VGE74_02550 [Gemmata sp.]
MLRSLVVPALFLCTAFGASAQPPKRVPPPERLVEQLGASDFATRERATEALRALGSEAIPAVRRAGASADPETRRRASQLLPELLAQLALAPRRVTLEQKSMTFTEALGALQRQTSYAITVDSPVAGDKTYSFGLTEGTFWEAVERVAERTGRSVVATRKGLQLVRGRTRSPFAVSDGAFRVELSKIHEDRDINFDEGGPSGKHDHRLTLKFSVLAEPRFVILAGGPVQFAEAVDERGGKLPASPETVWEKDHVDFGQLLRPDFVFPAEGFLRRSPKQGTRLATVSGTIPVRVVVEKRRTVVVPTAKAEQPFRVGRDLLSIRQAAFTDKEGVRISLRVAPDEHGMNKARWHQRVTVEDIWGVPLRANGHGSGTDGNEHYISVSYGRPPGWFNAPAQRIVVEDWVILEHKVRFTFKGVSLP